MTVPANTLKWLAPEPPEKAERHAVKVSFRQKAAGSQTYKVFTSMRPSPGAAPKQVHLGYITIRNGLWENSKRLSDKLTSVYAAHGRSVQLDWEDALFKWTALVETYNAAKRRSDTDARVRATWSATSIPATPGSKRPTNTFVAQAVDRARLASERLDRLRRIRRPLGDGLIETA